MCKIISSKKILFFYFCVSFDLHQLDDFMFDVLMLQMEGSKWMFFDVLMGSGISEQSGFHLL